MPTDARVTVEPVRYPSDHRGYVVEPLREAEFPGQKNAHMVVTWPGHVRGNHYHLKGTEIALVIGPGLVRYRDGDVLVDHPLAPGEAVRFTFPPHIPHAMKATGDGPMLVVAFNTEVHDPTAPDVVREVVIES